MSSSCVTGMPVSCVVKPKGICLSVASVFCWVEMHDYVLCYLACCRFRAHQTAVLIHTRTKACVTLFCVVSCVAASPRPHHHQWFCHTRARVYGEYFDFRVRFNTPAVFDVGVPPWASRRKNCSYSAICSNLPSADLH